LDGDERFVEHFAGKFCGLLRGLDEVDTAWEPIFEVPFAAATGVDLGLDDQFRTAEKACCFGGFFRGACDGTTWAGDLESVEKLFGLVFVDIHDGSVSRANKGKTGANLVSCPASGQGVLADFRDDWAASGN
jgi:hypothetical protein